MADPMFDTGWQLSEGLFISFRLKDRVVPKPPSPQLFLGDPAPNPAGSRPQNNPILSDHQGGLKISVPGGSRFALKKAKQLGTVRLVRGLRAGKTGGIDPGPAFQARNYQTTVIG